VLSYLRPMYKEGEFVLVKLKVGKRYMEYVAEV